MKNRRLIMSKKKFWSSPLGIILVLILLPFIGVGLLLAFFSIDVNVGERFTQWDVQGYLKDKYQIPFYVEVEEHFSLGTQISATPMKNTTYEFKVEKDGNGSYNDNFLHIFYERELTEALENYPDLSSARIKMFLKDKGEKFDFSETFPDLANITPTFNVTKLQKGEINREKVLDSLKEVMLFIEKEKIQIEELNLSVEVDANKLYHYISYLIPKEALSQIDTVEKLKNYETVKTVKRQQ